MVCRACEPLAEDRCSPLCRHGPEEGGLSEEKVAFPPFQELPPSRKRPRLMSARATATFENMLSLNGSMDLGWVLIACARATLNSALSGSRVKAA